jgi:hypothetical protein
MRNGLRLKAGWERVIWLWALVLLVLPNCVLQTGGLAGPPTANFDPGPTPRSQAIFCDIESHTVARHCATPEEAASGVPINAAATALNTRQSGGNIGLDFSQKSRDSLNCGETPVAITFEGPFPEGTAVCLNCGSVIPVPFPNTAAACVARCEDFFGTPDEGGGITPTVPPDPATIAFCTQNARPSTNAPGCFDNVCTDAGAKRPDFDDPANPASIDTRRIPEPVVWTDFNGTAASGNDLFQNVATTVDFLHGAASTQWISTGDAYVEFSVAENDLGHMVGLSQIPANCAPPCADGDATPADISFTIQLNGSGGVSILESGAVVGSFGNYNAGDRFRVTVRANPDGTTGTVEYSRLAAPCPPGAPCAVTVLLTSSTPATYPLRVDASFRHDTAKVTDVRIVRIQ